MNNLNSLIIEGTLVKDPDLSQTAKGLPVCSFAIANDRYFKRDNELEKETSYFNIQAFGKMADQCKKDGYEGRGVRAVGRLKQERWENAEGQKLSRVIVVAEHIEFRPEMVRQPSPEKTHTDYEMGR
jgi:single-strand DNA-binding protein